jgi:hypothetical protein
MGIDYVDVTKEIGVASAAKFNEAAFEFDNGACQERSTIQSQARCRTAGCSRRRGRSRWRFKKHGIYEKAPVQERCENTGKSPAGVKWMGTNQGDKENRSADAGW